LARLPITSTKARTQASRKAGSRSPPRAERRNPDTAGCISQIPDPTPRNSPPLASAPRQSSIGARVQPASTCRAISSSRSATTYPSCCASAISSGCHAAGKASVANRSVANSRASLSSAAPDRNALKFRHSASVSSAAGRFSSRGRITRIASGWPFSRRTSAASAGSSQRTGRPRSCRTALANSQRSSPSSPPRRKTKGTA